MNLEPVIKPGEIITWMGLAFETSDQVLVPRRETELLAGAALDLLKTAEAAPVRVIDMCCGAGNLSCALAHARPDIRVCASDLTDACVTLARRNVARHGLEGRVDVRQGDLFSSLPDEELMGSVDLVVCNPPYISTGKLEGESAHLLDALADPGPSVISAAASVIDDPATRLAMRAPGVVVIWLHARPDVLATRFDSADEHRPAYGDVPESFLADQAARREPLLGEVGAHVIDVDTITPDQVVTRAVSLLG